MLISTMVLFNRGSSVPENDRLASIAAELQFRSLSRHSSPTEEREEPSYPKGDSSGSSRRSWELRTLINQTKDTVSKQAPIEAVQKSVQLFEERRYREMRRKNIIGQVCDTPKSYDNVMHVGLRKVTFKWQRGNKIGKFVIRSFVRLEEKKKDSFFEGSLRLSFEMLHLRIGKTSVTEIRILKYKIQLHLGFPL